jgi:hypothetical protein
MSSATNIPPSPPPSVVKPVDDDGDVGFGQSQAAGGPGPQAAERDVRVAEPLQDFPGVARRFDQQIAVAVSLGDDLLALLGPMASDAAQVGNQFLGCAAMVEAGAGVGPWATTTSASSRTR